MENDLSVSRANPAHSLSASLDTLARAEIAAGLKAGPETGIGTVFRAGKLIVSLRLFRNPLSLWRNRTLFGQYWGVLYPGIGRFLSYLLRPGLYRTQAQADFVLVRTHIRGFYAFRQKSIKVSHPAHPGTRALFRNEVKVRKSLPAQPGVVVPELLGSGHLENADYLVERTILETARIDMTADATLVAVGLFRLQNAAGLETRPFRKIVRLEKQWQTLVQHADTFDFVIPDIVRQVVADWRPDETGHSDQLLYGLCHGDITPTNLTRRHDKLVIFDWEYGHRGLIFTDAVRLCIESTAFQNDYLQQVRNWAGDSGKPIMDPRWQLFFGALIATNNRLSRPPSPKHAGRVEHHVSAYRAKAKRFLALMAGLTRDDIQLG